MFKKSQAALEFLTTYAWAFLVILIMVGALAYFGILNPAKLLPDRCNFGSEITCDKNKMIVNNLVPNTLVMELVNNFGTAVTVTTALVNTDIVAAGLCDTIDMDGTDLLIGDYSWPSGSVGTLTVGCSTGGGLTEGEKIKFTIDIFYYADSAGVFYTKTVSGEAYTTIQ